MAAYTASIAAIVPALAASLYALASASLAAAALGTVGLALTAVFPIIGYSIYQNKDGRFGTLPTLEKVGLKKLNTELYEILKPNIEALDEAINGIKPTVPEKGAEVKSQDFVKLLNYLEQNRSKSSDEIART